MLSLEQQGYLADLKKNFPMCVKHTLERYKMKAPDLPKNHPIQAIF